MSQSRFSATITVDAALLGRLIGYKGSNTRRITSTVGAGCYIRGKDNQIKIEAYTEKAVRDAARMLKDDEAAFKNPQKISKPTASLGDIDPNVVPHIVGKSGNGLRFIMQKVGDGCWIVHRDGAFHITANTKDQVDHALHLLKKSIRDFMRWKEEKERQKAPVQKQVAADWKRGNMFGALSEVSPPTSPRTQEVDEPITLRIAEKPQLKGAWANTKITEQTVRTGSGESYNVSVPRPKMTARKYGPKTVELDLDDEYAPCSPDYTPPASPPTSPPPAPIKKRPANSLPTGWRQYASGTRWLAPVPRVSATAENWKTMGFDSYEDFQEENWNSWCDWCDAGFEEDFDQDKMYINSMSTGWNS